MDASLHKRAEQLATEFASQARTAEDLNGLMRLMMKSALERMLNTELDVHLGRRSLPLDTAAEGEEASPAPAASAQRPKAPNRRNGKSPKTVQGDLGELTIDTPDGPYTLHADWLIACDGSRIVMRHAPDGSVLDVGRKTRTVPPSIRRALEARDRRCRFPGCTARRCDAHHVEHSTPARKPRAPGAPAGSTAAPRSSAT